MSHADTQVKSLNNFEGWRQWIERDANSKGNFEEWCYTHFYNALEEEFVKLLHPSQGSDPDVVWNNEALWSVYLWGLSPARLRVLVEAYVDSHEDAFVDWAAL